MERLCSIIIEVEAQKSWSLVRASNTIKWWLIMSKVIIKSFRFAFKPSKTQSIKLNNTLRLCADLYNASLQERRDAYQLNHISINYQAQQNQLPDIKQTNSEYKNIHSQVLQNVLKRVDLAFQGFFNRVKKVSRLVFQDSEVLAVIIVSRFRKAGFRSQGINSHSRKSEA